MPTFEVVDKATGKTMRIQAANVNDARVMAAQKAPAPEGYPRVRQSVEGLVEPVAGLMDLIGSIVQPGAPRGVHQAQADRISSASAENPTQPFTFWRGVGRGAVGIGTLAATGGLSVPLAGSAVAGGVAGSEVESATDSPMLGLATDFATSLATGNPSAALRLAGKLRLGAGGADDAVNVATKNFEKSITSARAAFSRIPTNVQGTANVARLRDLARTMVEINGRKNVPRYVKEIASMSGDDVVSMDFNMLRRTIDEHANILRKGGPKSGVAAKLSEEIDMVLKDFEGIQSSATAAQALRSAREAWGQMRANFPNRGSVFHAVLNPKTAIENPQDALAYVFNAKNPVQEVQLLSNAVAGNARAESGLRRAYMQYLAQNPDQQSFGGVLKRFEDTREVAQKLFGTRGTKALAATLTRAAKRGGEIGNHPLLFAATLANAAGAVAVRGVDKFSTAIVAGTGAYWMARQLGKQRAQNILLDAAFDPNLQRLLSARATRAEAPEILRKITSIAVRNGTIIDGEQQ